MKLSDEQKIQLFKLAKKGEHISCCKTNGRGTKTLQREYYAIAKSLGLTEEEARRLRGLW